MVTVNPTTVPSARRRIRASLGLSLLALSALSSLVLAPGASQARTLTPIRLLGERVDADATTSAQARQGLMAATAKARGQGRATVHALIQLDGVPDATQRQLLRQANVHLQHYVPDSAWIVTIPAADPLAVESVPQVR